MSIMRCNPHSGFYGMRRGMGRLFREWEDEQPTHTAHWRPVVDIFEDGNKLQVNMELPGLTKDDVSLNIESNVLSITGERKMEEEKKEENYHRIERSYGSFERSFTLPSKVEANEIEASFSDGILKISMPKREEAKPRQIEVKVN